MIVDSSEEKERLTTVRLKGFRNKYQQQCPKKIDTIAAHLIEHYMEYFIRPDCPRIMLEDKDTGESLNLNDLFEKEMTAKSRPDDVTVDNCKFYVLHVRFYSSHVTDHMIHFCANNRVVKSEKLLNRIPNLARRLQDKNGKDFIYAAYVDSDKLDASVNAERTEFLIAEDDSNLLVKETTWSKIRSAVFESCRKFLAPYTEPVREKKRKRIEDFVATDSPMYRPILKYVEDKIDLIDPEINDDALDLQLYQAYHDLQVELRAQGQQLLQQEAKDEEWESFLSRLQDYFDKVTDINKADLARYVCHRRAILDFLHKQLSVSANGKYRREERIHQIIFPLRKTSDEVPIEEHNLWVLDEKLVYHAFLASDKPLRTNPHIKNDSQKEPDIVVFDKACAFAPATDPPFPAISIIEFKKPMRDDYTIDDNPIQQVLEYADKIREGKARTEAGRDIQICKNIPFFCYVVADITPSLIKQAKYLELTEMPEEQGFFGFRKNSNAYIEVLSYSKVLTDAKKRNAVFFRKLGLPDRFGQ
jgi:hypothetical protein